MIESPGKNTTSPVTKKDLLRNWAITTASGLGTVGLGTLTLRAGEKYNNGLAVDTQIAKVERSAQVELLERGFGFLPTKDQKRELIDPSREEIELVARSLKTTPEIICSSDSMTGLSITLAESCSLVIQYGNIQGARQAYLDRTNYLDLTKYKREEGSNNLHAPVTMGIMSVACGVLTIYCLAHTLGKSYKYLKHHITNSRLLSRVSS